MWRNPKYYPPGRDDRSAAPEPSGESLATFPRGRGAELRVNLCEFEGRPYVSLRVWENGWPVAGKGCSIRIGEIEGMLAALREAEDLAAETRPAGRQAVRR